MASSIIETELVAACSSLGYSKDDSYIKDPDCLETIRDLLRYLRRDDSRHSIRLALGCRNIVHSDLIPILREHYTDSALLDLVLRLLVNLTSPALVVFHHQIPDDKEGRQNYMRLIAQQEGFKEGFADSRVWQSVFEVLKQGLQQESPERTDDTQLQIEMCLVLLRNVLSIAPGRQDNIRTHDDADLHDQVLWAVKEAELPTLLHYLASTTQEPELSLHTLEIIHLMLRQQDAQTLATTALQRSAQEKSADEQALKQLRDQERARKQQQLKKHYSSRHPRFGGCFYVKQMMSISDRDLIVHRPLSDVNAIDFDRDKKGKKLPRNRAPLTNTSTTRRSTLAIRLFLQQFCLEFLNGSYNSLMSVVKDSLNRARTDDHDEIYYLWAVKFFMEFNRHYEFRVELISETLSIQTVHFVQTNIENYYEMMTTEKKKIPVWSRRMHQGLRAYHEILMTLAAMDKSQDAAVRSSALTLKSKIFYVVEYRELPLILLQNYDPVKMSKEFLKDLVEMTHIFLKLLEAMCQKTKHLMVQLHQKRAPKMKKKLKQPVNKAEPPSQESLEERWGLMADELSTVLELDQAQLPLTIPFDSLSELPEEEQKANAMRKINALLRTQQLAEALSLFRASREVWPEGNIFGAQDIDPPGEFLCLREIFLAELNPQVEVRREESSEEDNEEEEVEREESILHLSEREFDFGAFVRRFAHTKILQAYSLLLSTYQTNTLNTNHCVIKMFHRLAWDNKMVAIFFQTSLFVTFYKSMTDPAKTTNTMINEIVNFAKYVVRQFFKTAETNPKVFMEILFWKTSKEALEIECGYDVPKQSSNVIKSLWSEEEEFELRRLFEEFHGKSSSPDHKPDCVDYILDNLIRQDRSRRLVIKKLKEMGLISNLRELSKKPVRVSSAQWSETEEEELRVLFAEHRDAVNPLARIMDFMINPKPKKRVLDKLLELGLIQDKKEMRQKRVKKANGTTSKSKGKNFSAADEATGDSTSDHESDSDGEISASDSRLHSSCESKRVTSSQTAPLVVTPFLVSNSLNKVMEKNMNDCVQWLADIMAEVADDRETDGEFDPIPILTVTEEQAKAIEDIDFQQLMRIVGLQSPQSHEEMFWRVPSRITIGALRKRVQYLQQGLAGTLPAVEQQQTAQTGTSGSLLSNVNFVHSPSLADHSDSDKENRPSDADVAKSGASDGTVKRSRPMDRGTQIQSRKRARLALSMSDSEDDLPLPGDTFVGGETSARSRLIVESEDKKELTLHKENVRGRVLSDSEDEGVSMRQDEDALRNETPALSYSDDERCKRTSRFRKAVICSDSDDD